MRILLAHNRYRVAGGEEAHLSVLEEALSRRAVDTARFEGISPTKGASVVRKIAIAASMSYSLAAERQMRARLREWRPDVLHVHNLMPLLTPSILNAARRAGVRVVMTVHNHRLFCPTGTLTRGDAVHDDCVMGSSLRCGLRNSRGRWSESLAYGLALEIQRRLRLVDRWVDAYIVPAKYLAVQLERAGFGAGRIHVIPHGIQSSEWHPRPREFALMAGRLSAEKGVETLLDAAALAPDVPLVVAGEGPLIPRLRQANGSVRYVGLLDRAAIRNAQQRAAFSVLPSLCPEICPVAALESLAAGTPVLASRIGGLPEIVADDDSGVLVEPGDASGLAAAMRTLWERSQTRDDFGQGAWMAARTRFSLDQQIDKTLKVYRGSC